MKYALTNCVIYTAHTVLYDHAVIVEQDKIVDVVRLNTLPNDIKTIDLASANLTAGFIDLQLNGCGGVMFNDETTVETLEIMQRANLKSGTTSFLPTFITAPDEGIKSAVNMMKEYLAKHQNQALGLHLEGPYISKAKKGTHNPDYIRELDPAMKDFLLANSDVITKITIAAENPTIQYIPDFVKQGIVVSVGHSNASHQEARHAFAQGASFATHLHNAMSPISSGRDMGVTGAVLESDDIYTGIIVDGLHVTFGNVKIAKRVKGEKLCIVTDAVAPAGSDITEFTFVGKAIYVRDGKCVDADGVLSGSNITMIESLKNAVCEVNIPLDEALRMCNYYPAKAIHVDDKLGSIEVGKIANLTAFSSDFKVIGTAVNGLWQFTA